MGLTDITEIVLERERNKTKDKVRSLCCHVMEIDQIREYARILDVERERERKGLVMQRILKHIHSSHYKEALEAIERENAEWWELIYLKGEIEYQKGNFKEAHFYFVDSIAEAVKLNDPGPYFEIAIGKLNRLKRIIDLGLEDK
ncbi:hypothetical protein KY330_03600 [Candidatus Woesearchaeota archaeon]|nr:hypothetical protein [Candidatus Woesearchaeota archaeon]